MQSPRSAALALLLFGLTIRPLLAPGVDVAHANEGFWQAIATEVAPFGSGGYAVAYDALRNRLVAYFGYPYDDPRQTDVWALDLSGPARWTRIPSIGTLPTTGYGCSMIYDPVGDRLILYGGSFATAGSDLYQMNLSGTPAWSPIAAVGGLPTGRWANGAIYDPIGHRMIVYGGIAHNTGEAVGDVWALSLDGTPTWSPVVAAGGPGTRAWAQVVYDAGQHRMIVHGGRNATSHSSAWALSLGEAAAWTQISTSGPELWNAAAQYDASNHRMLIYGGYAGTGMVADVRSLSLAPGGGWTLISTSGGPGARMSLDGVVDAAGRFVVFSGLTDGTSVNDAWVVPASAQQPWTLVRPDAPRIDERSYASLVWDPVRERALLYGGSRLEVITGEVWGLGGSEPEWLNLATTVMSGTGIERAGASAVWDPVRDRMLVFGGESSFLSNGLRRDVLTLSGASLAWNELGVVPGPSERKWAAGAYDPVRDRMVFFAGHPAQNARNQTWSLALGTPAWTQLAPTGTAPGQRWGHTMTYDPVRDRMIVFGGGDGGASNGLYALSLAGAGTWTMLTGPGTPPPARTFHSAIYDPAGDRLVIWGGKASNGAYLADTWEYDLGGGGWRQLDLAIAPPEQGSSAYYDPTRHRMVIFGGFDAAGRRRDTWALNLDGQTTGVPGAQSFGPDFRLFGATPNPALGAPRIAFTLPPNFGPVRLELVDLSGRRVAVEELADPIAGRHVVDLAAGRTIAPGLYFARLSGGGKSLTAKVCLAR